MIGHLSNRYINILLNKIGTFIIVHSIGIYIRLHVYIYCIGAHGNVR